MTIPLEHTSSVTQLPDPSVKPLFFFFNISKLFTWVFPHMIFYELELTMHGVLLAFSSLTVSLSDLGQEVETVRLLPSFSLFILPFI